MRRAIIGLFTLACLYTVYFAADILVPLAVAMLLAMMLAPLVHLLEHLRIPRILGAGLVVLGAVAVVGLGINLILQPAMSWVQDVPEKFAELQPRLGKLWAPIEELQSASENISDVAGGDSDGQQDEGDEPVPVRVQGPSVIESVAAQSPEMIASLVAIVFLMYFMLAYGNFLLQKLSLIGNRFLPDHNAVHVAHEVQRQVSRYLLVFTLINTGLAVIVASALAAAGFPNPILWGVVAGVLNFAPYVGATITALLLAVVGLLNVDSLALALLVPAGFMMLTSLEGQLITPTILGQQLALSPYVVFLSIIVWGWMWGVPGALMAVPLVVIMKILADNLPGLNWLSILLRRTEGGEPQTPASEVIVTE